MDTQTYISIETFCLQYDLPPSFVEAMEEHALIDIAYYNESKSIAVQNLQKAEMLVRLNKDLGINPEGLSVVVQLLDKLQKMNEEIQVLKSRLSLYEDNE